jgi:hypothetical protein
MLVLSERIALVVPFSKVMIIMIPGLGSVVAADGDGGEVDA